MKLVRRFKPQPFEEIEAAEARHLQVKHDQVRSRVFLPVLIHVPAFQVAHGLDAVTNNAETDIFGGALELLLHEQYIVGVILDQ